MEIFKKEIFPQKHRLFVWAIVLLIVAGLGLLGYSYYEIYKIDSEISENLVYVTPQKTFKIEEAENELKEEINNLSSDVSDLQSLADQEEILNQDLNNFNF